MGGHFLVVLEVVVFHYQYRYHGLGLSNSNPHIYVLVGCNRFVLLGIQFSIYSKKGLEHLNSKLLTEGVYLLLILKV